MGRRRALSSRSFAALAALAACGSSAQTPDAHDDGDVARAWFGVRGVPCADVAPTLSDVPALRGAPAPWRVEAQGAWCAVAPSGVGVGLRIDSTAARTSEVLAAPAVAFYVTRAAWSYTVFDRGEPVLALESHLAAPMYGGDAARASALLEVEPHVFGDTLDTGHDMKALRRFAEALALHDPTPDAKVVEAAPPAADPTLPPSPERTLARIPPGTWAALPPLGVVLVKDVELRAAPEGGEAVPTYVIVDDMTTLRLPVARAEAMGMRPIASGREVTAALALIDDGVDAGAEAYDAARVKGWLGDVGSGDLARIARVFATLCALRSERKLFQLEEGLLATSREWLAEEIATARNGQTDAVDADLRKRCD